MGIGHIPVLSHWSFIIHEYVYYHILLIYMTHITKTMLSQPLLIHKCQGR